MRFLLRTGGLRTWLAAVCLVVCGTHSEAVAQGSGKDAQSGGGIEERESRMSPGVRWERVARRPPCSETSSVRVPALWFINVFRRYVSRVDGPSCTFSPSCSHYGEQAVRKNGLLLGVPMTAERIIRDHSPGNPDRYPLIESDGRLFYVDPVEANDFWWRSRKEDGE